MINTIIPATLDPLQFVYRPNRSKDDAISIALHTTLSQLDKKNTYSGNKKYVNPLEIPVFLHKLDNTFDLIFI